jgi:Fe2+ transport system protein FeoA
VTPLLSLAEAERGMPVRVVSVDTASAAMRRLAELGVVPGLVVAVMHSTPGALIVAAGDSRIAVGRTLAAMVHVAPAAAAPGEGAA